MREEEKKGRIKKGGARRCGEEKEALNEEKGRILW